MKLSEKIFGTHSSRELKRIMPLVDKIEELRPTMQAMTDEELNGNDYVAVPFQDDEQNPNSVMEIGYITRKNTLLSKMGVLYVEDLKKYLNISE